MQKVLLWSKLICVTYKLLMSVYLDKKLLYPHLKVNWNVLMCKICIARRLVVDIFPWRNANFVPLPSGTLVACQMRNGSINKDNILFKTHFYIAPCLSICFWAYFYWDVMLGNIDKEACARKMIKPCSDTKLFV